MHSFTVDNKVITLYGTENSGSPLVYFNTLEDGGPLTYAKCQEIGCPDFTMASITHLKWDHDMAPWATPSWYPPEAYCAGGANRFLPILLNEIMPEVQNQLSAKPAYCALTGYSLGGLFAVYSLYKTDVFSRIASASGSFWFPDFIKYVKDTKMIGDPKKMYFSVGNEESHSRIKIFSTVQENTEWLARWYHEKYGIQTTFVLNPGNHFTDPVGRMANGIKWMLEN